MRYLNVIAVIIGLIVAAPLGAQAQNYYLGSSNNNVGSNSSSSSAPIYTAPSAGRNNSSSPLMLNQIIDGSYNGNTRNGYSGIRSSSSKYALGQTPEQIAAKRARADATEKERQRENRAQRLLEEQKLSQAAQTEQYMQQVGADSSEGTAQKAKKRVYTYSPVNTNTTTPKRVFNTLR